MAISEWAVGLGLALALIVGVAAGFGTFGYIIAGQRIKRPFLRYLIRYAIVFLLLLGLEGLVLWLAPSVHRSFQHLTAVAVGWLLDLATVNNVVSNSTIAVREPSIVFKVDVACLGGVLFWAYFALLLAEPRAVRKHRVVGVIIGGVVLILFNLFRIFISIFVESKTGVNVHNYFYLFNLFFVLLVWAGWVWSLGPRREADSA